MKTLLEVFFSGNVLSSSPCKHSNMTFWMKTQNGGLVAFAHSSYCLTIHWLLVLFIDQNILEEQDTSPLKGIKTYGCFQKCARISVYFVFTFSQSVHSPECLTLYSHVSVEARLHRCSTERNPTVCRGGWSSSSSPNNKSHFECFYVSDR